MQNRTHKWIVRLLAIWPMLVLGGGAWANVFDKDALTGTGGANLIGRAPTGAGAAGTSWAAPNGATVHLGINTAGTGARTTSASPNVDVAIMAGTPASGAYDVESDVLMLSNANNWEGPIGHVQTDGSSWDGYAFYHTNAGNWEIWKYVAGSSATHLGAVAGAVTDGTTYHLKLTFRAISGGWRLTGYSNGTQVTTADDTSSPINGPGKAGIATVSTNTASDSNEVIFSNFSATDAPVSFTSSATGVPNNASTTLTLTGAGTAWTSGTTFSVSGVSGASIVTNSVNVGAQTASVTITTGTAAGVLTLSDNTDSATLAVNIQNLFTFDNSAIVKTKGSRLNGTQWEVVNCGEGYRTNFGGTSCTLHLTASAAINSRIIYTVDNAPFVLADVTSASTTVTMATGLASGTHSLYAYYASQNTGSTNRWTAPALVFQSLELDAGASLTAATVRPYIAYWFGDSYLEGQNNYGTSDAYQSIAFSVSRALNAEPGFLAFGGQAWTVGNSTQSVPPMYTPANDAQSSWNKYYSGVSRLTGGLFTTQPDFIFSEGGRNDAYYSTTAGGSLTTSGAVTASVSGWLTAVRAAAPSAKIFVIVPMSQGMVSAITTGYNNYETATPDANCTLINLGVEFASGIDFGIPGGTTLTSTAQSGDAVHPYREFYSRIASAIVQPVMNKLQPYSTATGGTNRPRKPGTNGGAGN